MKKRGQFYLIATIIIVGVLIGFFSVTNQIQEKTSTNIQDISKSIELESEKLLETAILWSGSQGTILLWEDLAKKYSENLPKDMEIIFITGKTNNLQIYTFEDNETAGIMSPGLGIKDDAQNLNANIIVPKIRVKNSIQPKQKLNIPEEKYTIGENNITLELYEQQYVFKLKEGFNFYFIVFQTINNEKYVVTNLAKE
jgi:hypothetical protein